MINFLSLLHRAESRDGSLGGAIGMQPVLRSCCCWAHFGRFVVVPQAAKETLIHMVEFSKASCNGHVGSSDATHMTRKKIIGVNGIRH